MLSLILCMVVDLKRERAIDLVHHSTLGLRVINKMKKVRGDLIRCHLERESRFGPLAKGRRFGQRRCESRFAPLQSGRLERQARGERVDGHARFLKAIAKRHGKGVGCGV